MTLYTSRWIYAALMSTLILITGYFFDIRPMMQQLQILEEKKNVLGEQHESESKSESKLPALQPSQAPLLLQKNINLDVMQAIQASGLHIHAISKTEDTVFQLVLEGQYESLYQFVKSLPRTVWVKQFHVKVEKNTLRVTLSVLFTQSAIVLKIAGEPSHNPFCLPRLIIY